MPAPHYLMPTLLALVAASMFRHRARTDETEPHGHRRAGAVDDVGGQQFLLLQQQHAQPLGKPGQGGECDSARARDLDHHQRFRHRVARSRIVLPPERGRPLFVRGR